jgi:hypothetical protein
VIPAYICNRDRLHWPRRLASELARTNWFDVIIVDSGSSFPPLLSWYASCPYPVVQFADNEGPAAVWRSGLLKERGEVHFLLTDPDLDLSGLPPDWPAVLMAGLEFPTVGKVGLGLRTDDIPAVQPLAHEIRDWEANFTRRPVNDRYLWARIDTTLALYDRSRITLQEPRWRDTALRTRAPYLARHLPWYPLTDAEAEDESFYRAHCDPSHTHWTRRQLDRESAG